MGATRPASGIVQLLFSRVCIVFFSFIIPTRDASPPLELAFGGSALRLVVAFCGSTLRLTLAIFAVLYPV